MSHTLASLARAREDVGHDAVLRRMLVMMRCCRRLRHSCGTSTPLLHRCWMEESIESSIFRGQNRLIDFLCRL